MSIFRGRRNKDDDDDDENSEKPLSENKHLGVARCHRCKTSFSQWSNISLADANSSANLKLALHMLDHERKQP